jgi:adenine-specific DNA-methyltransferase
VWEIPNVRAGHREKVGHPCQFPVALAERFVRALCPSLGAVYDPFSGSATTGVAAAINGCRYLGSEVNVEYQSMAHQRLTSAHAGALKYRPVDQPIYRASPTASVARRPETFLRATQ